MNCTVSQSRTQPQVFFYFWKDQIYIQNNNKRYKNVLNMTSINLCRHSMYNNCKYSGDKTRNGCKYLNIVHLHKERQISSSSEVGIKQEDAILLVLFTGKVTLH